MSGVNADAKAIFLDALECQDADELHRLLDQACGVDAGLRARVEELLRAHQDAGNFLGGPNAPGRTSDRPMAERPGTVIGPYKLLEQIGEGGFGLVFMAEQQQPVRRKVAVKVLKPGMDSRQVIARFEAERQALALMDHVNIARVLEAGETDSGRPYFAMELVRGVPITEYCDNNNLPPRQRLELFLTVCQAVQHAHQKGIIHRDIKPSNVLVTMHDGVPVAKVIDFGIAKALGQQLTDKTLYTAFSQLVGTPLYMSPEQAEMSGLDVDTRSDIYSLGVLLYELLTGTTPFEKERLSKAGYDEVRRIIREEEPVKPSTRISTMGQAATTVSARRQSDPKRLSQLFRGELDWIVMKALDKDRNRRYETASALASDIQGYLKDEPVAACPPSPWYRMRKFSRRNHRALTTGAVVTAALALVGGSIGWMALERATRQAETVRQVDETIAAAHALLDRNGPAQARQKLAEANGLMGTDRAALAELAAQVDAFDVELDRLQRFLDLIDRGHQGEIVNSKWQPASAVAFLLQALALYEVVERDDWYSRLDQEHAALGSEQVEQIRRSAFEELLWLADDVISRRQDHGTGQQLSVASAARQGLAYLAKAEAAHPPIHGFYVLRARCRAELGETTAAQADRERALKIAPMTVLEHNADTRKFIQLRQRTEAIKACEAALRLEPTHFRSMMLLGYCLCDLGQGADDFRAAAIAFTGCLMKRPENAHAYHCRANAYTLMGRLDEALKDNSMAIKLDPEDVGVWISRGGVYLRCKQVDKAVADYSEAIRLAPNNALAWTGRGHAYRHRREFDKALADYTRAIEIDDTSAHTRTERGVLYAQLGQFDKALADYARAVEVDDKFALAWSSRGGTYTDLGRVKEALADLDRALALDPKLAHALYNRATLYRKLGERQNAMADYSRFIALDGQFAPAWQSRGLLYAELGQGAAALADYARAIELTPNDPGVWNNRAGIFRGLKQPEKAVADFTKAIKLSPKNAMLWSNRGSVRAELRLFNEALADFAEALALDSKYVAAWTDRGTLHIQLGHWEEAISDYSRALELSPRLRLPRSNRAFAHGKLGQWDKATADMAKCLELEPNNAARHNELAWLLATHPDAKVRDPRRAVQLAKIAVKLTPTDGNTWNTLGVSLYRAGDWKGALKALGESTRLQGENGVDALFQAMAHWQTGEREQARIGYDRAISLLKNGSSNEELRRFRAEAAQVLGMAKREK